MKCSDASYFEMKLSPKITNTCLSIYFLHYLPFFSSNNLTLYFLLLLVLNLRKNSRAVSFSDCVCVCKCVCECVIDKIPLPFRIRIAKYVGKHIVHTIVYLFPPAAYRTCTIFTVFGMTFFSICCPAFS